MQGEEPIEQIILGAGRGVKALTRSERLFNRIGLTPTIKITDFTGFYLTLAQNDVDF